MDFQNIFQCRRVLANPIRPTYSHAYPNRNHFKKVARGPPEMLSRRKHHMRITKNGLSVVPFRPRVLACPGRRSVKDCPVAGRCRYEPIKMIPSIRATISRQRHVAGLGSSFDVDDVRRYKSSRFHAKLVCPSSFMRFSLVFAFNQT